MTSHRWDPHGEWDALAVGWALSTLDPEDEAIFLPHLASCERCTDLVAETTRTVGDIGLVVPEEEPPPQLKERLMAAVRNEPRRAPPAWGTAPPPPPRLGGPDGLPSRPPLPPPQPMPENVVPLRRSSRWRPLTAAAAAVIVVAGLGGWNVKMRGDMDSQRKVIAEVTRPGTRVVPLLNDSGASVGAVLVRPDGLEVLAAGLDKNADSKRYWLWSIKGEAAPSPLGGFDVSGSDPSVQPVGSAGPDQGVTTYAISSEPRGSDPKTPTTPLVAKGPVG
jgi:hypothetical protein